MIDWDRDTGAAAGRLAYLTAAGTIGSGHESTGAKPVPEKIDRLTAALSRNGADVDVAANLVAGARAGLAKARDRSLLTLRERAGLEAVILTDGTRPSLTIQNGFVNTFAPEAEDWGFKLRQREEEIRAVIASVGRINVPVAPGFAGTCFVIAPDRVVTNRHVLEEIAAFYDGKWTFRWPRETVIDFTAEDGTAPAATARVVAVDFAGPKPINARIHFPNLDLALLRTEPIEHMAVPPWLPLDRRPGRLDADRELYVVGFPGRPHEWTGEGTPPVRHETNAIMRSVFDHKFGVKKLAPGKVERAIETLPGDIERWVFSHDASTLGGNSGSAAADLHSDKVRVAGIHFGGRSRDENYAHGFAALADVMTAKGGAVFVD